MAADPPAASQETNGNLADSGISSGATAILVVYSGSCGEAEFEACQVAGSLPV